VKRQIRRGRILDIQGTAHYWLVAGREFDVDHRCRCARRFAGNVQLVDMRRDAHDAAARTCMHDLPAGHDRAAAFFMDDDARGREASQLFGGQSPINAVDVVEALLDRVAHLQHSEPYGDRVQACPARQKTTPATRHGKGGKGGKKRPSDVSHLELVIGTRSGRKRSFLRTCAFMPSTGRL